MSAYDKTPFVPVPGATEADVRSGWKAVAAELSASLECGSLLPLCGGDGLPEGDGVSRESDGPKDMPRPHGASTIPPKAKASLRTPKLHLVIECYPGVDEEEILSALQPALPSCQVIRTRDLFKSEEEIEALCAPFLGGDDPVFGYLSNLKVIDFLDPAKLAAARRQAAQATGERTPLLVLGTGASLVLGKESDALLVHADLARWEAQLRFRRNQSANLGTANHALKWSLQYKRAFFIDWRAADRLKEDLIRDCQYLLDTHRKGRPLMVTVATLFKGYAQALRQPFRVVPFFDPAPWGGQWMREKCGLDPEPENFGWCFDGVPEENSLLLGIGPHRLEVPSLNLVKHDPDALLGERVRSRFGAEFPIRFDFLDTIGGGHLSFQVHPRTEHIQREFGIPYTQDESYYILDAEPSEDPAVYLGLKEGADPSEMIEALEAAQRGEAPFDAEKFVCRWPAGKHDHFLIPAGTPHCSGKGTMVLEISATPYIFTYKLWDWGRLGLDGLPRPINIERAKPTIAWDRTEKFVEKELVNAIEKIAEGDGWTEERTGLHALEFIETRRHWFTKPVPHDTGGNLNVLNLVEGAEAVVESPAGAFEPFPVHYAETFIVPAAVGPYLIRPAAEVQRCATLKAFVRA